MPYYNGDLKRDPNLENYPHNTRLAPGLDFQSAGVRQPPKTPIGNSTPHPELNPKPSFKVMKASLCARQKKNLVSLISAHGAEIFFAFYPDVQRLGPFRVYCDHRNSESRSAQSTV